MPREVSPCACRAARSCAAIWCSSRASRPGGCICSSFASLRLAVPGTSPHAHRQVEAPCGDCERRLLLAVRGSGLGLGCGRSLALEFGAGSGSLVASPTQTPAAAPSLILRSSLAMTRSPCGGGLSGSGNLIFTQRAGPCATPVVCDKDSVRTEIICIHRRRSREASALVGESTCGG